MATYALIHGAGDVGWYWHLVAADLRARGHDVVAPDLPCEDESAGLADCAGVVLDAIGDRDRVVVVAQSFGGYTAPIVCAQMPAELLVLVAGMVPRPGETAAEMFASTGFAEAVAEAGGPEAADALPRRPPLPGRMEPGRRPPAPGPGGRRDRRRPLPGAQPSAGARPSPGGIPVRAPNPAGCRVSWWDSMTRSTSP